jgi:hypothetical protein
VDSSARASSTQRAEGIMAMNCRGVVATQANGLLSRIRRSGVPATKSSTCRFVVKPPVVAPPASSQRPSGCSASPSPAREQAMRVCDLEEAAVFVVTAIGNVVAHRWRPG